MLSTATPPPTAGLDLHQQVLSCMAFTPRSEGKGSKVLLEDTCYPRGSKKALLAQSNNGSKIKDKIYIHQTFTTWL